MTTPVEPAATTGRTKGPGALARRPEIVPIAATVLAWAVLVFQALAASEGSSWIAPEGGTAEQLPGTHAGHGGVFSPTGLAMVALMTVAMMAPLAIPGVRTVSSASPCQRTGRSLLWFFGTYLATWTVFAVCLAPVAEMLGGVLGSAARAAGLLTLACAVVQFDPRRTVQGRACDRPMRTRIGPMRTSTVPGPGC